MAELVDAQDSKSCDRKVMRVRFSLAAPSKKQPTGCFLFYTIRFSRAARNITCMANPEASVMSFFSLIIL